MFLVPAAFLRYNSYKWRTINYGLLETIGHSSHYPPLLFMSSYQRWERILDGATPPITLYLQGHENLSLGLSLSNTDQHIPTSTAQERLLSISHLVSRERGKKGKAKTRVTAPKATLPPALSSQGNRLHCAAGLIYVGKWGRLSAQQTQRRTARARQQSHRCGDHLLEPHERLRIPGPRMGSATTSLKDAEFSWLWVTFAFCAFLSLFVAEV